MKQKPYRLISHTADIGVRVRGGTLKELFANAAFAMFDLLTDVSEVRHAKSLKIRVIAADLDELMVTWLGELLYKFEVGKTVFSAFKVLEVDNDHLVASVKGEKFAPARHEVVHAIKAVTYHQLKVHKTREGWATTIIFDV